MSRNGQSPAGTAVFVGHFTMPRGTAFATHTHPVHQLAVPVRGLLRVSSERGSWLLPPSLALWIPAGLPHLTEAAGDAFMHSAYIDPARCPRITWTEPTAVAVGPLQAALVEHLAGLGLPDEHRSRAEAVLLDVLTPVPVTSVAVRAPRDPRARAVADALSADPADSRPMSAWGAEVGAGERTLARIFVAETGLPFGQWRERLRMQAAMPLLADGLALEAVARRTGYASASSFVAAFHRVVGVTPRQYFPARS
ncbi:AraC family transcriptional regulator [Streptomyces populi]|uniref:HTH-type transcriptional regulator RipA n=1 Tax=Streptomyces populi TaxID=2058924 RepID=A0A2I0SLL2_9ACTN|nr:helix-turn-helix transcriptional regulator [Streptomyces populi]PKT70791.1 AraC family transcriptional regulator [Streptomyces populi]